MRPVLAMPLTLTLLVLPATLSAQIAPSSQPRTTSAPAHVRIEPATSSDYELRRSREAIRDGRRSDTLTKMEARALRREADQNDRLAKNYRSDGLSYSEQRELEMRGRALQSLTEAQRTQPKRP